LQFAVVQELGTRCVSDPCHPPPFSVTADDKGRYRATTPAIRLAREPFLNDLLGDLTVYPYTKETALLPARVDAKQRSKGVVIPFGDLLIGATALLLGFSVLTMNIRHFPLIPGLTVTQL
jgi:predicted nucleic acid-binding protein